MFRFLPALQYLQRNFQETNKANNLGEESLRLLSVYESRLAAFRFSHGDPKSRRNRAWWLIVDIYDAINNSLALTGNSMGNVGFTSTVLCLCLRVSVFCRRLQRFVAGNESY